MTLLPTPKGVIFSGSFCTALRIGKEGQFSRILITQILPLKSCLINSAVQVTRHIVSVSACWKEDTHERPTFPHILQTLDDIARSKFHQMDDDNFYDLQDDWKAEIDETLHEIREREKVKL